MNIEETTSSAIPSSQDYASENFNWIEDKDYPNENKEDFLKYPLNDWIDIVFDPKYKTKFFVAEGIYYQSVVNKILGYDIFKDCEFYGEKNGIFGLKLNDLYKIDPDDLEKKFIAPDFFVHRIEVKYFLEILENRSYMMRTNYTINKKKKYVTIIGETKMSHHQTHKKCSQKRDYLKFIKLANSFDEELLLMYVYDESFQLFKKDLIDKLDNSPIILCYIPKCYQEDCYFAYNYVIDELKSKIKKIDINRIPKKKLKKREILIELENAKKRLKEDKNFYLSIILIMSIILVIIISISIKKFYF